MSHKRFSIVSLVLLFTLALAACGQSAPTTQAPPAAQATQPPAASQATTAPAGQAASQGGKLEVFSWWTSGGEAAALDALFKTYAKQAPGVEIVNATIAGGGGSAARGVLQTRLTGGNPPDTWQVHPGLELLGQYVEPGYVEPITDLYQSEGWDKAMPKGLIDQMTKDGQIYSVLAGVHRGNGLWYNKQLLDKAGVTVGKTMSVDEFFAAADKLKAAGTTPLCVGDQGVWASAQLFENTLLGVLGPDKYLGLWNGSVAFDAPEVKQAITAYGKMLDYQNQDHSALTWDQAVKKLIDGGCAFNSMGDWAYGEFVKAGKKDNVDFGWVSHPGTDGNRSKFDPYHNWSMDSFAKDKLVASVVHGEAAPAEFQQALNDAVTTFIVAKNVDAFATSLTQAAKTASFSK